MESGLRSGKGCAVKRGEYNPSGVTQAIEAVASQTNVLVFGGLLHLPGGFTLGSRGTRVFFKSLPKTQKIAILFCPIRFF